MWMPSQSSQAVNPPCRPNGPSQPMLVTPARRPMTATSPWSLYAERLVRPAEDAPPDDLRRVGPALHRALGDARGRLVRLPRLDRGVADHEDLGMAGDRQVRLDDDPAGAVGLGPGRLGDRPRERAARTPAAQSDRPGRDGLLGRRPGRSTRTPSSSMVDDPGPRPDLDAEPLELALRRGRPIGRIGRQDPVHRLDEDDPGLARPDRPEVALERVVGDLAERAGELDAGRSAADEHERHPRPATARDRPRARRPRRR